MEQQIWNIGDLELYWKHGPDDNSSEDLWRSVWETTEWSKVLSNLTYSLIGKILNLFAVTRPKKCIGRWHWLIRVPFTMMSVPIPKSVMHKLHFVLARPKKGTEREATGKWYPGLGSSQGKTRRLHVNYASVNFYQTSHSELFSGKQTKNVEIHVGTALERISRYCCIFLFFFLPEFLSTFFQFCC